MSSASSCSAEDFEFVCKLVRERGSITIDKDKQYLVEARLGPLAHREGMPSVGSLVGVLRSGAPRLIAAVVDAMTTNETSFFRDVRPFDALRAEIIPSLLRAGGASISLWSAAASTGQEAYSMALVMREHFSHAPVTILGTDLSQVVIERARRGRFTQAEVNRGLPASLLIRYFEQDGLEWQLNDSIRRMVTFQQANLARPLVGIPPMDVIFLRNVLIYFDTETKRCVLAAVGRVLKPGGYLFLGAPETTYGIDPAYERLEMCGTVCYRLRGRGDS